MRQLRQLPNDHWQVSWSSSEGKQTAQAAIYIDATGRKSSARNKDKVSYQTFDQLVGIGLILEQAPPAPLLNHLILKTCAYGWWYCAPLSNGQSVLFLMTDLDIAKTQGLTQLTRWKAALPVELPVFDAFRQIITNKDKLIIKQAQSQVVHQVHVNQFFTVGDALVSFDPVTGSGIIRALQTALGLSRVLTQHGHLTPAICRAFLEQIHPLFERYLQQWRYTYSTVEQWKEAPFWQRRRLRA